MQQEISKAYLGEQEPASALKLEYDFSKFAKDGFEVDEELISKFQPVAKKLNLSQESVEALLELALEMSIKQRNCYIKDEKAKLDDNVKKYDKMFRDDPDLPDLNTKDAIGYMKSANAAYSEFCSENLKKLFEATGLNYHPELIKMFHKIGELMAEDNISYAGKPKYENLTPAQILYGDR